LTVILSDVSTGSAGTNAAKDLLFPRTVKIE